jgi:uncharacterized repeat protein (TIGR01451 family)
MKSKRLFQIFVLLTLLFSPFGNHQPVGAADQPDVVREEGIENQPTTSIAVSSPSIFAGDIATVTVSLNNVPVEGYTSIELTCYYSSDLVELGDIFITDLFGPDPAVAISEPYPDRFIAAIAGAQGDKATTDGPVMIFDVIGLEPGQALLDCQARVSKGDNVLTGIDSTGGNIMILGNLPTSTSTAAMRITIDPGQTTATRIGVVNPNETIRYLLNTAPGQVLSIKLTAPANEVAIGVNGPTGLALKALDATPTWSVTITTSGDHTITLMALTGSSSKSYTLEVSLTPPDATATPTFSPISCDRAEFIADINVPPGTVMSPGAQFVKTWRLKNVGSCAWTLSYRLAFLSGDQMSALSSIQIPVNVPPGATVDLSLPMTAPSEPGSHRGYWIFQNSTGQPFGIGSLGNEPWFVDIVVVAGSATPTPTQPSSILNLTKTASSQTYGALGQTITYTFTITNTGTVALGPTQFTITDSKLAAPLNCGPANVILAPSQSLSCSMAYTITSADVAQPNIINVATAAGAGQVSAPATAVVTNLAAPATPTPDITPTTTLTATHTPVPSSTPPVSSNFLKITSPNGGEVLMTGSTYRITWDSTSDINEVYIGYKWCDSCLDWIAPGIPNTGYYDWNVLLVGNPASQVKIYIYGYGTAQVTDESDDFFTIVMPTATVPPSGTLTGQVLASKPVTLELYDLDNTLVTSVPANPDGTFSLTAPAGTYSIVSNAPGFLSARGAVTVIGGSTGTKPTTSLLAGDVNGDSYIDQYDALTIGMNYNTAFPSAADLNNDGIINVLDLELLARNYRKVGPVDW